ncbi:Putative esterase [Corynebacterium glaucum]|uniref:Putative esterase n=1 Tax=Corynebacterium glaucum TaxID=187491 RepID=A0A1Q2HWI3_9CORY|nr:PaaI family thioesterase [Corynebacterium glaucum]AQQ15217.1 Putative esterase [Corynebacterium glaucum]
MTLRDLNQPVGPEPLNDAELAALNAENTGFAQHIGMVITYCSSERLECYVDVEPHHLQAAGIVNGGVYASIGETLGSAAAIVTSGKLVVGMSNNTDLLSSVTQGRIEAVATPVHVGRSTHLWRIEMRNGDKLVAVTNLKLMILS